MRSYVFTSGMKAARSCCNLRLSVSDGRIVRRISAQTHHLSRSQTKPPSRLADVLSQPRSPSRSPQPSPSQSRSRSPSRASDELSCASREPSPGPDERSERSASGSATSSKSQSRPSKRSTGHRP
ncbi:unnamed protein product [Symbiodinium microadriaticum]|nr:unnamed protein product [Symbiodinium microadriaticum]CAE7917454.1 unnamed protein product [Symbiodinium sp. KB8]